MQPVLHIVASCSDRKSVRASVRLRDFRAKSVFERFGSWRHAIAAAANARTTAEDLYQGEHWSVVRGLPAVAASRGWRPHLWVCSAGYGIVQNSERIVSYSATFAAGHEDFVGNGIEDESASARWWGYATSGSKRLGRSLASIAESSPSARILLLASPPYLAAMADDISASLSLFRGRGTLLIVSSRVPTPGLADHLVTSRASLQGALGGTLVSLHARAASHLLQTLDPSEFVKENIPTVSKNLEVEMGGTNARSVGSPLTDEEVIAFIRSRLKTDPNVSHTRLLRELRASQRACEQGRFRRLFRQLKPAP